MAKTAKKKASASAKKTAAPEAPVTETPENAPAPEGAQITIADMQAMANVIDSAVRRGAFGAEEVGEVSAIYTKLANFLKTVAEQQRQAAEQQQAESAE